MNKITKYSLLLIVLVYVSSCKNDYEKMQEDRDTYNEMMAKAEESAQIDFITPEGLNFKMTEAEVVQFESKKRKLEGYIYRYHWSLGKNYVGGSFYPSYDDGKLCEYSISLDADESEMSNICDFLKSYLKKDYSFEELPYYSLLHKTYLFTKNNLAITLAYDINEIRITYENRPVSGPLEAKRYAERQEREKSSTSTSTSIRHADVKNNKWNGGVKQVEDYLKYTYLRDPDSYESIEWSEVKEKEDGYYVRHKYRAKNGFGGYVVANQLFHLDFSGNVVDVKDLY